MAEPGTLSSIRPLPDQTSATAWCDSFDRQGADPLGLRRVLVQLCHDLYGTKDVQNAITATYVWAADQLGHITLGLVPTLLFCWIIDLLWPQNPDGPNWWHVILFFLIGSAVFAFWAYKERKDLEDTIARATTNKKGFPPDSGDLTWNVKTALLYFAIGGVIGILVFISWKLAAIALFLALWPAASVAFWWLRRKLSFQQAGLPYLYRLANFRSPLETPLIEVVSSIANLKNWEIKLLEVLFGRDYVPESVPAKKHLLITGPLNAGKTSLCVGIGTEFAFALGMPRYLTSQKLVELVLAEKASKDKRDYDDGRVLWAWRECELLLVDDVDAGVTVLAEAPEPRSGHLIRPEIFEQTLSVTMQPLEWLHSRRSVWVIGDATQARDWRRVIASLMGAQEEEIAIVGLELPPELS